MTADAVKAVHRTFPSGVTIITTMADDGRPRGLAVNAFASLSIDPPLVLVCISRQSTTHDVLFRGTGFAVNVLASTQAAVARRFATSGGNKFADVPWKPGMSGAPVLDGVASFLETTIVSRAIAATHTVFVAQILYARAFDRAPLVYLGGSFYGAEELSPAEITPASTADGTP
jgi:flavin reductase (DIM6/NTAB) family NADH-FMN oxidoreductase RutF